MAEYIGRDVAFNAITDLAGKAQTRSAYEAVWKSARALKKIPAADVAPVVHAQWIEDGSGIIICPECKRGYNLHAKYTHYCPHCGAKMDGGEE